MGGTNAQLLIGQQVPLPGHFDPPDTLESARLLGKGFGCCVRLHDGSLDEAIIPEEKAAALAGTTPAAFGRNVHRLREARGLTQEGLAEEADLDRTYISDIEQGMRNPGIKNVARLAKALDVTAAQLMEGVGE